MMAHILPLNEGKDIEYSFEHVNSYSGQDNYELGAYIDGNIVGLVEYVIFNKELTVSNIVVVPAYRRKGIASRMMQMVKDHHPEARYRPSMMTPDGTKFKHKEIRDLHSL